MCSVPPIAEAPPLTHSAREGGRVLKSLCLQQYGSLSSYSVCPITEAPSLTHSAREGGCGNACQFLLRKEVCLLHYDKSSPVYSQKDVCHHPNSEESLSAS